MQNEQLLTRLQEVLTPEEYELLSEYDTPEEAWLKSRSSAWMIRILSLPEFAARDHRRIIRLGIRLLEHTPVDGDMCIVGLITNKRVCDFIQVLNLYAEGYAPRTLITNNSLPIHMKMILRAAQNKWRDTSPRLGATRLVWHLVRDEPSVEQIFSTVKDIVQATTKKNYPTEAYRSLPGTIRKVYRRLPTDLLLRRTPVQQEGEAVYG